eukprot:CAMPEP_0172500266 /NCGR_PEP_ID=MMETSP1066-20121228/136243_1 /TAXON_ID=671091 /ORGANISM="Coscinodiscus wailesii, Strain CCMP2513" /LENGTH=38 /DNA_ID= /DNA_START= /DNA_END= /DNA_ORIENTATION=
MMDVEYDAGGRSVDRKNKRSRGGLSGFGGGMERGFRAA